MIADMKANKKNKSYSNWIVFKRQKNSTFYLFFHFKVPKTIRLNATHYFAMKIPNKRELKQTASNNHSFDIELKYFMRLYKDYPKEPYSFLMNYTTLASANPLIFRKSLL